MVDVAPRRLRLVFFGTPEFAVPGLEALVASRHHVVGAVTQPDRPRGRGQKVSDSPVKHAARAHGIPVVQPDRLKDESFLAGLRAWQADLGVVAAYGKILPAAILDVPPRGLVNVHASLLPRHRGAAPVHRAVLAGDTETGVSIMRVVQALDAGAVFATVTRPIGPDDTSAEVEADLARIGATLLVEVIDAIADGRSTEHPQDPARATYAHRLRKEEGPIDWTHAAEQIHDQVRGLQPWPLASTSLAGRRLIVLRTRVTPFGPVPGAMPGTVTEVAREGVRVQTGTGLLDILVVQPEGRRPMPGRDFAAGHRLTPGVRFDAPPPPVQAPDASAARA
ncbi:MAG: methionyl-tRNA formyltransferase [Acidobacteria bacterium]|nr:methionyl-tRNA formyltransferase [Acidobacteriota bacterium]